MRKYEPLWEKLKTANPETGVVVTVKSEYMIQTIINALQNEKSLANVSRKRLDLPAYGKLVIVRDLPNLKVTFRLTNSGAAL